MLRGYMIPLASLDPMSFIERRSPPADQTGWTTELKFDGYRCLASIATGAVQLRTKGGADCTRWYPEIVRGLASVPGGQHVLDGEVVVLDDIGRPDFDRLHRRSARRGFPPGADPVVFAAFDLLMHRGVDVRTEALIVRKALLAKLLEVRPPSVLLVEGVPDASWLFSKVLELKLEGIVCKRLDSPYRSGVRTADWVKVKRPGAVPAERFRR